MTLQKTTRNYILAALFGCFMPLAFAPFKWWFISILSVAGLVYLWDQCQNKKQFFLTGLYFGLAYFGLGLSWVYYSLHDFGNAIPLVAGSITLLLIIWQSLYIAVLGLVYASIKKAFAAEISYLLLPLLWFAMEWLKGIVLTGLPWLSIGYSHVESPLSGWAPWLGSYGLSAISVLLSITVLLVINGQLKQKAKVKIAALMIMLATVIITDVEQTEEQTKALKITQVQGNIAQHIKWQASKRQEIFDIYWQQTKQHWDSDLIVWPETAVPGRSELIEESVLLPMSMLATENETNVLFGVLVSDVAKSQYYNSMLMVGENQGMYHKRHLVPFGEYMPLRALLSFLKQFVQIPMSDMQMGDSKQPLMSVNGIKLGISICYEDVFSRDINLDLPAANILINTSNDAWFGDSLAPHQHLQIAQMRALEVARPMVRSTNTGITAFIDHKGQVRQKTQQFEVASITANIVGRTGSTFFVQTQAYQWIVVLLMLIVFLWAVKINKQK